MNKIPSNSGGSAMAGGQRYQAAVTTWWMVRILLQTDVSPIYQLNSVTFPDRISSETTDAIDDLRVDINNGYKIFGQCKRRINLSGKPDSDFSSVLKQFYLETERQGDFNKKRFVLYFAENNSNLSKLNKILDRFRNLEPDKNLTDAAFSEEEKEIVKNLESLLDVIQNETGYENLKNIRNTIMRQMFIHQLQLDDFGPDKISLTDTIQHLLLTDGNQSNLALTVLHRLADDLMADRESRDGTLLREKLTSSGIRLRDNINYRSDFEKLEAWSFTELSTHEAEGRTKLKIGDRHLTISRPVVKAILKAAETESFLVIGDAGIGKTGCLHAAASQLKADGKRLWYWTADSLPYYSVQEMASHLQLDNIWMGIFAEAAATSDIYLIIDGLDGLRDSQVQKAYRQLINLAMRAGVKVIASIRKFDLRYASELSESFRSGDWFADSNYYDPSFRNIRHISVTELDENEYQQIFAALPQLKSLLNKSPELLNVVHNLFSLELLCKLIEDNESVEELSSIATQAQLFDRFWRNRIDSSPIRKELVNALQKLIDQMVSEQSLQAIPQPASWTDEVKKVLFSNGIIRNPPQIPGRIPEENLVEFTHHLMFDYAAERLFVRHKKNSLETELRTNQAWGLFLRPSVVLFFRYLWSEGRVDYWETLEHLQKSDLGILQLIPAYLVAGQEIVSFDDFEALLNNIEKDIDLTNWIEITQQIISAATFSKLPDLFSKGTGGYWIEFAKKLIETGNIHLVAAGRWILSTASNNFDSLSSQAKKIFAETIINLIEFQIAPNSLFSDVTFALKWICRTIELNSTVCSNIIRRFISAEELKRTGYVTARAIAENIDFIWKTDPSLAVEIYDALFKHVEADGSQISIGSNVVARLTMNRAQVYQMSQYVLIEKFDSFLNENPANATKSLIFVLRSFKDQSEKNLIAEPEPDTETFDWDGSTCVLRHSKRGYYNYDYLNRNDDDDKLIEKWKEYLKNLPGSENAGEKWNQIKNVLSSENDNERIWVALLEVGKENPYYFAPLLWTILTNSKILINSNLYQAAEDCITAFAPLLTKEKLELIENAIFTLDENYYPDFRKESVENHRKIIKAKLFLHFPEHLRSQRVNEFLESCSNTIIERASIIRVPLSEQVFRRSEPYTSPLDPFREIYDLANSLVDYSNPTLTEEIITQILQNLENLETKLREFEGEIDEEISDIFRSRIISCLHRLVGSSLPLDDKTISKAFEIFTEKLAEPQMEPSEDDLRTFDRTHSYNPENSRTVAAEGFIYLLVKKTKINDQDKQILKSIIDSPIPIVRMMGGRHFFQLLDKAEEFVRETLTKWLNQIPSLSGTEGVLNGTLNSQLIWRLRSRDEDSTDQFIKDLIAVSKSANAESLLTKCGNLIANLGLIDEVEWAKEQITEELKNLPQNLSQLFGIIQISNPIIFKDHGEKVTPEQRARLLEFTKEFLKVITDELNQYFDESHRLAESGVAREEAPLWVEKAMRFLEQFARQIERSAEDMIKSHQKESNSETDALANIWWSEMEPLFEELLKIAYPPFMFVLIEAIQHVILFDVEKGLHWLRRVTFESAPQGLTDDNFVANTTIKILENVLADYRGSLKTDSQIQSDFIQILEAYLQRGYERAVMLAIRIESIFR